MDLVPYEFDVEGRVTMPGSNNRSILISEVSIADLKVQVYDGSVLKDLPYQLGGMSDGDTVKFRIAVDRKKEGRRSYSVPLKLTVE